MSFLCDCFSKKRITCLLGSGATIPVGGPTTHQITQAARVKSQHVFDPISNDWINVQFIDEVANRLDNFLAPVPCHFEDIFHALESLESIHIGWQSSAVEKYKPRLAAFVQAADARWFNSMWLIAAKQSLVEAIAEQVELSNNNFQTNTIHDWFKSFWVEAFSVAAWDIATLNYDNLLEQISPELEDGFELLSNWARFNAIRLLRTKKSRMLHLHGSIHFGYLPLHEERTFIDYGEDLCKYRLHSEARQSWFGRSPNTAQSHEEAIIGPLITGLRKTDKITAHPYDDYQAVFRRCIYKQSSLLIAGYSFGDLYLNSVMNRMLGLHGSKRRIVIVTWFPRPSDEWHCDPITLYQNYGWPNEEMYSAFGASMNSINPLGTSLIYCDKLVSADGCCRIYLGGTQEAFQKYGDEILDFLLS